MKLPKFDHFDLIAPYYDRALPLGQMERLVELVGLPAEGVLLDVGGGTGRVAHALRECISLAIVADASMGMLAQGKSKFGLYLVCSLSERLPFPDNVIDRITIVDALHHLSNQSDAAGELFRVLKPGGRLVIEEPNIDHLAVKLIAIAEKLLLMRSHFLNPQKIAGLFTAPSARHQIAKDGSTVWVIIEKVSKLSL
jgi:demethylmenaquinone methyltransferase/2-methoxy-6-polyprenyl-1,4-benzoquinol methylase